MCCSPFPELIRATVQAERLTAGYRTGPTSQEQQATNAAYFRIQV
jgi:hypothetical protein